MKPNELLALVADDPDVRAAAKQLSLDALHRAQFLLQYGNDDVQMRLISIMGPTFRSAAVANKDDDNAEEDRKKKFLNLINELESDGD